jgi:hypothetical protein
MGGLYQRICSSRTGEGEDQIECSAFVWRATPREVCRRKDDLQLRSSRPARHRSAATFRRWLRRWSAQGEVSRCWRPDRCATKRMALVCQIMASVGDPHTSRVLSDGGQRQVLPIGKERRFATCSHVNISSSISSVGRRWAGWSSGMHGACERVSLRMSSRAHE